MFKAIKISHLLLINWKFYKGLIKFKELTYMPLTV